MIYHSTQSDDDLWCVILLGKQKKRKLKHIQIQYYSPFSMVGTIMNEYIPLSLKRSENVTINDIVIG